MSLSKDLIDLVREAAEGKLSTLAPLALRLCEEYEQQAKIAVRMERCLHNAIKRIEELNGKVKP